MGKTAPLSSLKVSALSAGIGGVELGLSRREEEDHARGLAFRMAISKGGPVVKREATDSAAGMGISCFDSGDLVPKMGTIILRSPQNLFNL